jgi:signal transduction histidine kinase
VPDNKARRTGMDYRLALEKLIEEGSRRLINATLEQVHDQIHAMLRKMGEFAGVDRSYVFVFSEHGTNMSNTHEWCAPGVEPQIEMLQELPVANFPWIIRELKAERVINLNSLDELPPEASNEKEILEIQDIQSLAIVPMRAGGTVMGYLGFDSTKEHVRWRDDDFALLGTMGNLIASALVRLRMEKQLLQSNKMEALGRFAGGIAHDFNNILTTVKGNIQLLRDVPRLDEEEQELLDAALKGAESGRALTERLLDFSRNRSETKQELHLHEVLSGSLHMLQRLVPREISIHTDFRAEQDLLHSDSSQLEQIIMNLVKNSADAMPNGGEITIHTRNIRAHTVPLLYGDDTVKGDYLLWQVIDTGEGMSEGTAEKALEPFFTTKSTDEGTGLGLSTVYTIVRRHGGYLRIDSKPGEGTAIDIYLPLKDV